MPQLHHRHPTFNVGRHPNKRVKVKERALKQSRELKLPDSPMPSAVIDLGIDRVSELIRSVTYNLEDAYQDAWVAVLEDHVGSEEDILRIAREVYHKHNALAVAREHKEISLDEPIGERKDEGDFTLKDILQAPLPRTTEEIDHDIDADTPYIANSSGKLNRKGSFYLDDDTKAEIKRLYPHDTIHAAIRKVVQMPPAERDKRGWYKWEDAIIRQRYPWGGARACSLDICRSLSAINSRAKYLGIQVDTLNTYKPCPGWLNIPELAERLGCKYGVAARLEKTGKIKAIRIPNYHQGHDGVFFTPEAINDYLNSKELHRQEVASKRAAKYRATWEAKRIAKIEQANANLHIECRRLRGQLRQQKLVVIAERGKIERHQVKLDKRKASIETQEIALRAEQRAIIKASGANERKATKLKQRQLQLTNGARRVGQRLRKLAWVEATEITIKEVRQNLHKQEIQLRRQAKSNERTIQWLAQNRNNLREGWRALRQQEQRLAAYAQQLRQEEQRIDDAREEYRHIRRTDLDIVLETISCGQATVAKWGDKSHYVSNTKDGNLALACRPSNSIPIETLRQYAFNPFVNGLPTCRKCLGIKP
jgi:hypothetical protein